MIFQYDDKLTVEFSTEVENFFQSWMDNDNYLLEAGGILVGTVHSSSRITITDITTPQYGDNRLPYRFLRSEKAHQNKMDALWRQSGFKKMYLGEWHTHREPYPHPSYIDTIGWKKIAKKSHNSSWMLFLILGQEELRLWTIEKGKKKELYMHAK